ncbi:MAG: ATP-binding protein [bacterium]
MSNLIKHIIKKRIDDQNEGKGMTTPNKILILGSFLSSFLVIFIAWIVIDNTQKTLLSSYHDFGIMLARTLSTEGSDFIINKDNPETENKFRNMSNLVIRENKDILYIVFLDNRGNILFSNKQSSDNQSESFIEISQPVVAYTAQGKSAIGSVQLGLTGYTMKIVGQAARYLMMVIFSIAWILSIAAVSINTLLIARQVKLLVEGVRKISTGEFGYKLASRDLWGEIKQLFEAFNDMSIKLREYEEKNIDQLTYERNKLESILMGIANGVIVCDNLDKIVLVNNAALKMMEVKTREILNVKITDYYDGNGDISFKEEVRKFKDTPLEEIEARPQLSRIKLNNKIVKLIMSPIFTNNQEYLGYIAVLHDITKEAEIDMMKNQFISNVSHELRTPVTVIRSYIDTLHNYGADLDDKTKKEFMSILDEESDRLNRMVNDILDFSRLESPNVELDKSLCDISPVIELTLRSMKVLADEKKLQFSVLLESDLPQVMFNSESIERVIKNLISNAIKYSYTGGRVKIRAEVDRTGKYLQVSVEDNGMGIPQEHLPKIFDRFYRVETKAHTIKGTGLGLHLVKIAIEKHHGGQVFAESKNGEGSTFGFRLPLQVINSEKMPV